MLRANVYVLNTPFGQPSGIALNMNALDDKDSQRSGGSTLSGILSNIKPSVLRFPGNELGGNYLYFKSPYTDANTQTVVNTATFPANIPGYFNSATNVLQANVMNLADFTTIATAVGANVILSVSCVPSANTNIFELTNVATALSVWCETRKIHPYAFELNDANATGIASALRSANSSFRIYTPGVGNVAANGFWSLNQPVSNARPAINTSTPGNWFGNYVSSGLSLNGSLRSTVNGTFVQVGSQPSYVVSSAADTTRLVSPEGWPNVNDWGHGILTTDIIGKQLEYSDLVVWSSTRATTLPGGAWSNGIYSCLTNTNGYTPVGRAIQGMSQIVNRAARGMCPVSIDTNLLNASVFTDSYTTGLQLSGNLALIITNKSNSNYVVDIHHGLTRPGNSTFTNQLVPTILNNTTTAGFFFTSGNLAPSTFGLKTTANIAALSMNGAIFGTSRKITTSPILTCPIDVLNTTSPYGVWDTRTIIPGKPTGLSGYRDMKLSTFERFTDPGTGIKSNTINCFFQIYSGGNIAANLLTGGFNVASNPNVFPRSNLAVFSDIFYTDNFDFGRGGKTGMGLFVGQQIASGGNYKLNSSSARCVFRSNGESSLYMYVPRNLQQLDPTMNTAAYASNNYGVEFFYKDTFRAIGNAGPLRRNSWNEIGIGVKVNTFIGNIPQYDGSVFMSINGVVRELNEVRLLANTGNIYDNVSQAVFNSF